MGMVTGGGYSVALLSHFIGGCQMTRVEMIYQNNIIIGFSMEGHAGFNTKGPDIVCASLSATSQMTVNGILDWTGLSLTDIMVEYDQQYAILHIELAEEEHNSITVQQLFKSFEMYVEMLVDIYQENVKLERRQKT